MEARSGAHRQGDGRPRMDERCWRRSPRVDNAERVRASQGVRAIPRELQARPCLDERRSAQVRSANVAFVAIAVRDEEQVQAHAIEMTLPNGRVVTFAGTWDAAAIAPWLHALNGAP